MIPSAETVSVNGLNIVVKKDLFDRLQLDLWYFSK